MSEKPNRPRPASIKLQINRQNMPEEYITQPFQPKPSVISVIKIEDKLLNNQIAAKKRLESLKQDLEQEKLKELQSKPRILEKSRILAQKAEQKLFSNLSPTVEPKKSPETPKVYSQVQPDLHNKSVTQVKIVLEKTPTSRFPTRAMKKRNKSLLNLSVLERNEVWLAEKQNKIGARKKIQEEKELSECTFSPTAKAKSRNASRSVRENPSNNLSFISGHQSDAYFEANEQNFKPKELKPSFGKQIAPFQVKVSFKCGIDIESFLRRAK